MDQPDSTAWFHQVAEWSAWVFGAIGTWALATIRKRFKRYDEMQVQLASMHQNFVSRSDFEAYKVSREQRDDKVDTKLDDIKDAISEGLHGVNDRVDTIYRDMVREK